MKKTPTVPEVQEGRPSPCLSEKFKKKKKIHSNEVILYLNISQDFITEAKIILTWKWFIPPPPDLLDPVFPSAPSANVVRPVARQQSITVAIRLRLAPLKVLKTNLGGAASLSLILAQR